MIAEDREVLEAKIREHCHAGDFRTATSVAFKGYGREIFTFLMSFHRSESDAAEVFGAFSERVWKGIPSFEWGCSFRTWAYTIARNASHTYRSDARNRGQRFPALPADSELGEIAEQVRTETRSYLKTHARDRIAELRDALPKADRMLLTLRIDRKLSWLELARVLHDGDTSPGDADLQRSAALLRKRFQRLKEKLVEQAVREGLVKRRGDPA